MEIVPINEIPKDMVSNFFSHHWESTEMVISSGVYKCDELDGFASLSEDGSIIGLITYIIDGCICEIISLDSSIENNGIGSALVKKAEISAMNAHCTHIKIVTTNDNLHALGFYQRRGYRLLEVDLDAVDRARKIKPEIPLVADNGIPIRDEIILVKSL